ncbi:MAG: hypothetical protein ACFFG0_46985 [Candidatus Thorarchaeota archaeon]
MKKSIKYLLIGIIGISSFATLLLFNFVILPHLISNQSINNNREKLYTVTNISVYIDYSGVRENELFQNTTLNNYETTAYHSLLNCCEIKIRYYGSLIYVEEINGVGIGWIYWINNDPLPGIASNHFYLIDNETVNWKYIGS